MKIHHSLFAAFGFAAVGVTQQLCAGDNCLNALRNKGTTAISFCNTYTDYATVTPQPTPTYVPATCGPARLSSACYCDDNVANPSYTPAPCPTGQVLQNPSFYRYNTRRNRDIRPWVIAVPSGSPGCVPGGSYSTSYMDLNWGDPRLIQCNFNETVGGKSTVGQEILLCPSTKYTFTIHTACDFYSSSGGFGIQYRVTLNGNQVLIPTQLACPACADPTNPKYSPYCRSNAIYETFTANFTSPAGTNKNTLLIEVSQPAGLNGQQVTMLMDQIFINPVGNTDTTDPSNK